MRGATLSCVLLAVLAAGTSAQAACGPDAIGTSRTIVIDPSEHIRLGTMQYRETLPLRAKEVVLTFDDGPLPPYSQRILETLRAHCAKATYFMVGRMARAYPDVVRATYNAGHTIGTHSQNHPLTFDHMATGSVEREIDTGIASVAAALGDPQALTPFFRIPGLNRSSSIERLLAERGLMTWSADFPADDWRHIQASEIVARALSRLEAKGKGILLLHDIQPATALALPVLLAELKTRGYSIVHVVAAGADRPKTVTDPEQWVLRAPWQDARDKTRQARRGGWPQVASADPDTVLGPILQLPGTPEPGAIDAFGPTIPPIEVAARPGRREAPWPGSDVTGSIKPRMKKAQASPPPAEPEFFSSILAKLGLRGATP